MGLAQQAQAVVQQDLTAQVQIVDAQASAVIMQVGEKPDRLSCWLRALVARRGMNKAVVALANKNARVAFAIMHGNQPYDVTTMCQAA